MHTATGRKLALRLSIGLVICTLWVYRILQVRQYRSAAVGCLTAETACKRAAPLFEKIVPEMHGQCLQAEVARLTGRKGDDRSIWVVTCSNTGISPIASLV